MIPISLARSYVGENKAHDQHKINKTNFRGLILFCSQSFCTRRIEKIERFGGKFDTFFYSLGHLQLHFELSKFCNQVFR